MERYYLVLNTLTATARHSNPGEVHMHIYGKRQKHLYAAGSTCGIYDLDLLTPGYVREYGYTRKQDAVRNWVYTHPDADAPQWKGEVRLVQAWVRHNGTVDIIT